MRPRVGTNETRRFLYDFKNGGSSSDELWVLQPNQPNHTNKIDTTRAD